MPKKFVYYGLSLEELQRLSLDEFSKLLPSRNRRVVARGFTTRQKKLLEKIRRMKEKGEVKPIRTHLRDMVVLPEMVGLKFAVHNGKEFVSFDISPEMVGHRLGEFALTRRKVSHGAPGIGATRSSLYIPLK